MRKSKFPESQIVTTLEGAGVRVPVAGLFRPYGTNGATYFR